MRRTLGILVIGIVLAACGDSGPAGGGGGNVSADAPPLSVAWFGSGYDPATFGLTDKSNTSKAGAPLVTVGHLFAPRAPEDVSVTVSTGGSIRQTLPVAPGPTGPSDLYAADLGPANLGPATYIISFVDKRGSILASGNLNIVP
jgi:hypothetical protein